MRKPRAVVNKRVVMRVRSKYKQKEIVTCTRIMRREREKIVSEIIQKNERTNKNQYYDTSDKYKRPL
jgi:hypothetical protein